MKITHISKDDFVRAVKHTSLSENGRDMAFEVLVLGKTQADVARAYEIKKQWVSKVVGIAKKAFLERVEPDLAQTVRIELELPANLAKELLELANSLAACNKPAVYAEAINVMQSASEAARVLLEPKKRGRPPADKSQEDNED